VKFYKEKTRKFANPKQITVATWKLKHQINAGFVKCHKH